MANKERLEYLDEILNKARNNKVKEKLDLIKSCITCKSGKQSVILQCEKLGGIPVDPKGDMPCNGKLYEVSLFI